MKFNTRDMKHWNWTNPCPLVQKVRDHYGTDSANKWCREGCPLRDPCTAMHDAADRMYLIAQDLPIEMEVPK